MTEEFPKKIWLQREEGAHPDCSTYHGEGMTWCEDKINNDDVEYMTAKEELNEYIAKLGLRCWNENILHTESNPGLFEA